MMNEWGNYKLKDIAEIKYGKDHKKLENGNIPVYGSGGIMRYVNQYLYDKESVLIPRKGTLNNVFFMSSPFWTVDTIFWTKINEKYVIPKYLYYYINQLDLASYNVGTAVPSLTTKLLNEINISLPTLPTQRRIVAILSSLDDKIENNRKICEKLEEMAQMIFKRWFVEFNFPDDEGLPYKDNGGEMVDSEVGAIPRGWESQTLQKLVTITRGASPRPIQEYLRDKGIPWVKIADATKSSSKYLFETNQYIKKEGEAKSRKVTVGQLILSNSATPGIPKIMQINACVHDGWLLFKDYLNITKEFVYFYFLYNKQEILSKSNGSVFRNLKTDILKNSIVVVPDKTTLDIINKTFVHIDKLILKYQLELRKLQQTRDTLLPKLMSGEKTVEEEG